MRDTMSYFQSINKCEDLLRRSGWYQVEGKWTSEKFKRFWPSGGKRLLTTEEALIYEAGFYAGTQHGLTKFN